MDVRGRDGRSSADAGGVGEGLGRKSSGHLICSDQVRYDRDLVIIKPTDCSPSACMNQLFGRDAATKFGFGHAAGGRFDPSGGPGYHLADGRLSRLVLDRARSGVGYMGTGCLSSRSAGAALCVLPLPPADGVAERAGIVAPGI